MVIYLVESLQKKNTSEKTLVFTFQKEYEVEIGIR